MADANEEVLQEASQALYGLDLNAGLRRATGLDLDANGICMRMWFKEFNEAFDEMLAVLSSHALLLPGASGAYLSTPDDASLDIVGDIDIRVEFMRTAFTGSTLLSKWTTTGNQRSYKQDIGIFGTVHQFWSTAGIAELQEGVLPSGLFNALRTTIDVDNGAAGNTITFYSATSLDGPWTQIGQEVNAGVTSIFSGSAALIVGAQDGGTSNMFTGRITRAQVRSGIDGTIVANPDMRNLAAGTTSFPDSTGKTWTVNGQARVI